MAAESFQISVSCAMNGTASAAMYIYLKDDTCRHVTFDAARDTRSRWPYATDDKAM